MLKCVGWGSINADSSDVIFQCNNEIKFEEYQCPECIAKIAYIKKMPSGKYRVLSGKGKNLGESKSRKGAEERLKEIEYFKHMDRKNKRKRRKRKLAFLLFSTTT